MSNIESISARLRRWADESEVRGKSKFPSRYAARELGIRNDRGMYWIEERELFRHIADEIDREKREITERYARQSWMNPADAIAKLTTGEIEWAELRQAIDRYYLPRPLFDDGEPVYIGAEIDDRKRGKLEVSRICYTDGGFYFNNSRGSNGRKMKGITYEYGERVKRPKPQVLDSDGVPIEVGDVLWRTTDGMKVIVAKLEKGHFVDGDGVGCNPSYFTHREPDTQERIDGDALKCVSEYWGCTGVECMRCPALVDGEKPRHRYGVDWCSDAMTLDLLRRQRELDGRDA